MSLFLNFQPLSGSVVYAHHTVYTMSCTPRCVHHVMYTMLCTPRHVHYIMYTMPCTPHHVHHAVYTTVHHGKPRFCTPCHGVHFSQISLQSHVTTHLSQSEGSILSNLSDLVRNREISPKIFPPFKEQSCYNSSAKKGRLQGWNPGPPV